jgi:hypothetical protein
MHPRHDHQEGKRPGPPQGNDRHREERVVTNEPKWRAAQNVQVVDEHMVHQAVVPLQHEAPGNDPGVDRQRVRHQEQCAQAAAPAKTILQDGCRGHPEQPGEPDNDDRVQDADRERVQQRLTD